MTKITEILFIRYGLINTFKVVVALSLITVFGCEMVPINPNDSSPPKVTIKVNGPNGYQEQTSVNLYNPTLPKPMSIMCIVEDPQGVKSIDLRVVDTTVNVANCFGTLYTGTFVVEGLPSPVTDTLSGSSGKVPTKLACLIKIPENPKLTTTPPGETGPCYPGNNQKVIVRGRGGNWSSNQGVSTSTKYLDVNFKY